MSSHADPFHRRESYHTSSLTRAGAAEKRRRLALDAQKLRRTHAIEAARNISQDLFDMEDLSLAGSYSSDEAPPDDEERQEFTPSEPSTFCATAVSPPPKISKQKRKSHKPTFKSWAKNLLCHAETLDLRERLLPYGFERDWRMSVVPKGKRCLCATTNDSGGKNTVLYSRVAGRTLGRLHSILPGDCLLDVVWDREQSILWVLDTCKWRGNYIVECEADFRAFFTSSKLSELSTQYYIPSTVPPAPRASRPLLVLPCPTYAPPLVPTSLLPVLTSLSTPSMCPISVLLPAPAAPTVVQQTIGVPFEPSGVLLYHRESHYESGTTPLVNWVPCDVEAGREECEGVERFVETVVEWDKRGGEAGVRPPRADETIDGDGLEREMEPVEEETLEPDGGDFTKMRA
ncbi:hypothetical protein JCM11491_001983 [Sporobolomyces phaffii]